MDNQWGATVKSTRFNVFSRLILPNTLPATTRLLDTTKALLKRKDEQSLALLLNEHPYVQTMDQRIVANKTGVELAKEQYKPQWGINASYAVRDDTPAGISRADFLSVGVSFDLPIFTGNRQDQAVSKALSQTEAAKTDKLLVLRSMMSSIQSINAEKERLQERKELYDGELLQQMQEQAEASLNAYTNDEGDFAEVVRARIADLNARIDALDINVDLVKTRIQLNYYFYTGTGRPLPIVEEQ